MEVAGLYNCGRGNFTGCHGKELRFDAAVAVWRVAFAFDPYRKAILLTAGDKSGGSEKRFYRQLMDEADERFDAHLAKIKKQKEKERK